MPRKSEPKRADGMPNNVIIIIFFSWNSYLRPTPNINVEGFPGKSYDWILNKWTIPHPHSSRKLSNNFALST